jgi:hypothetical protein
MKSKQYSYVSYKTKYDTNGNSYKLVVILQDSKVIALCTNKNTNIFNLFGDVKLLAESAHFENMPISKKGIKDMIKYYCKDSLVKLYT